MDRKTRSVTMLTLLLICSATIAYVVARASADSNVIATVDIAPDTLNIKSQRAWITCYIELGLFEVQQIYISTIRLNGTIPAASLIELGDFDDDTVPDLMIKFNRTEVTNLILQTYGTIGELDEVTLTVTGDVGTLPYFLVVTWEGNDTIRIVGK